MSDQHPERPKDYTKIENSIERRANLIVDMLEDRAQHVVDQMDEPPPGTLEPTPETTRAMWDWSPYGERAPEVFWMLHDAALSKLMANLAAAPPMSGDEKLKQIRNAHQQAEMTALQRVYPWRATVCMLGITTPERSIELAKHAQRLTAQGGTQQAPQQQEAMSYG